MADERIQNRAWRFLVVYVVLIGVACVEMFFNAPSELILVTIAGILLCFALFTLQAMLHMGWRTYDIVRWVIMAALFIYIFTRPYPEYWLILTYIAIIIPLNYIYPDKTPRGDGGDD